MDPMLLAQNFDQNCQYVYHTYPNMAQHAAVSTMLLGPLPNYEQDTVKARLKQLAAWRSGRIQELRDLGWRAGRSFSALLQCPPFGCRLRLHAQSCKLRIFCPFCHGRKVLQVYDRFAHGLFATEALSVDNRYVLVLTRRLWTPMTGQPERDYALAVDWLENYCTSHPVLPDWVCRRSEGAVGLISLDSAAQQKGANVQSWRIRHSLLMALDVQVKVSARALRGWWKTSYAPKMTRTDLAWAVARGMCYPTGILAAPAQEAYYALMASRNRRLLATSGLARPGALNDISESTTETMNIDGDFFDSRAAAVATAEHQ